MALTPKEMDRKRDEHFGYEARDDVEGVPASLSQDARHDIVGWPPGPSEGREGARSASKARGALWSSVSCTSSSSRTTVTSPASRSGSDPPRVGQDGRHHAAGPTSGSHQKRREKSNTS